MAKRRPSIRRRRPAHHFGQTRRSPPRSKIPQASAASSSNRLVRKYRNAKVGAVVIPDDHTGRDPLENMQAQTVKDDHKASARPAKVEEATAAPNPIPDTGQRPSIQASSSTSGLPAISFTPLPSLLTPPPAQHTSTSSAISPHSSDPTKSSVAASKDPGSSQPHTLSTLAISLISVGSVIVLLVAIAGLRVWMRPRRRPRPQMSLPILEKGSYMDDDSYQVKTPPESPLFGGKERLSAQTGGLYTWTQYSGSNQALAPPAATLDVTAPVSYGAAASPYRSPVERKPPPPLLPPVNRRSSFGNLTTNQSVFGRVASRLSAASMSIYPASPPAARPDTFTMPPPPVGVHEHSTGFTADGHKVMRRSSRAALRKSYATDLGDADDDGLAYSGADVSSPRLHVLAQFPTEHYLAPAAVAPAAAKGRAKIKSSYYAPGTYPRMSSIPSALGGSGSAAGNGTSNSKRAQPGAGEHLYEAHPLPKSESRRDKDTRELAAAMGLASPTMETIPLSPQPTLYPDDSLSVVEVTRARSAKRSNKRPAVPPGGVHRHQQDRDREDRDEEEFTSAVTPAMDTGAALGSLMLMDFGATNKSLATLAGKLGAGAGDAPGSFNAQQQQGRYEVPKMSASATRESLRLSMAMSVADELPPRVPSPPPLPSLAQMGLEHTDPEGFANYKSPTYSIYNYYGDDRKSTATASSYVR